MSTTADARLLKLETKVAYQDKTIAELNEVVTDLNRALAEMAKRLEAAERVLRAELGPRDMPNEAPPHY